MDLLDRLEGLLQRSAAVPLTDKKVVAERELLGLVQMIRAALPGELREAHRLRTDAEALHRTAQDEARRIVLEAQATARRLVDDSAALKDADRRGHELLTRAGHEARGVREGADAYAGKVLADLEDSLLRILEAVRNGRRLLKDAGTSAYNEQSDPR